MQPFEEGILRGRCDIANEMNTVKGKAEDGKCKATMKQLLPQQPPEDDGDYVSKASTEHLHPSCFDEFTTKQHQGLNAGRPKRLLAFGERHIYGHHSTSIVLPKSSLTTSSIRARRQKANSMFMSLPCSWNGALDVCQVHRANNEKTR